jgi:adenylate cyclase
MATRRTSLTSGDTILTWTTVAVHQQRRECPVGSCGTELPLNSKFCNECGAPVKQLSRSAEYKQVTVLFVDVVDSMDIAAAVGAERLREIMAELVDRAAVVVQHLGGTVGGFTGDGVMAVFGAPVALADRAIRA